MALNRRNTPLPKFGERFDPNREPAHAGHATLALAFGLTPEEAEAAAQPKPEKMYPQKGDRIFVIKGEHRNQLLRPEMLEVGDKPLEGYPLDPHTEVLRRKNPANRMLVLRMNEDEMDEPTRARSADGVLVYSTFCAHRGCSSRKWSIEEQSVQCTCAHAEQEREQGLDHQLPMTRDSMRAKLPTVQLASWIRQRRLIVQCSGTTTSLRLQTHWTSP